MYKDESTAFCSHEFMEFKQLCEFRHEQIHVVWDVDMNESQEVLAFSVGDKRIWAEHEDKVVTKEVWAEIVGEVKGECRGEVFYRS
jgi:hypothetical protein